MEGGEEGGAVVCGKTAEDLFHDMAKPDAPLFEGLLTAGGEGKGGLAAVFRRFFAADEAGADEVIDDACHASRIKVAIASDQRGKGFAAGDSREDAEVGKGNVVVGA